jgi:hypothetical protein
VWFAFPAALVILRRSPIYGNFRQLLFLLPPLFLIVGWALEWIHNKMPRKAAQWALALVLITPGVAGIVRLHPYEYAFFNVFAGGTDGAYGRFDLDYWCTSYRQSVEFLNSHAPTASTVLAWGPDRVARSFAREDLEILATGQSDEATDYVLRCDKALIEDWFFSDLPVVYEVRIGEAVLSQVMRMPEMGNAE